MNLPSDQARRGSWNDWLLIFLFATLLWLPTVDYFSGVDVTRPPGENRLPARWPQLGGWNFSDAQKFIAGSETYFNDHFGFRKRLILSSQQWKQQWYHAPTDPKVVKGKHGWLFTSELQMIEHYLGTAKFSDAQMQSWQKLLEKRRNWLAARGIKFLFVITPDKQSIYPEELPDWLQAAAPAHRETKLDQFLQFMREHSTVGVLDLRPALLAAKTNAPLFLQTDSHWNYFGGFVAGQEVIRALQKTFPELPPLRGEDFTWDNQPSGGGDLARMAGRELIEKNCFTFNPKPGLVAPKIRVEAGDFSSWGTYTLRVTLENPEPLTVRAVVFHDSFARAWQMLFGYSFKRIVFQNENRAFNAKLIEENRPQVVINEMLERFFNTLVPEELMAKDALP